MRCPPSPIDAARPIAGPLYKEEGILYADTKPELLRGVKWNLDVDGHYARPDVFEFRVDRSERKPAL